MIAFDFDGDEKETRLHRIARNISLHKGQESSLESGQYSIKVGISQPSVKMYSSWMSVQPLRVGRLCLAPIAITVSVVLLLQLLTLLLTLLVCVICCSAV